MAAPTSAATDACVVLRQLISDNRRMHRTLSGSKRGSSVGSVHRRSSGDSVSCDIHSPFYLLHAFGYWTPNEWTHCNEPVCRVLQRAACRLKPAFGRGVTEIKTTTSKKTFCGSLKPSAQVRQDYKVTSI